MIRFFQRFINIETLSGGLLFAAALFALCIANSHWQPAYENLLTRQMICGIKSLGVQRSCIEWINEGLMALFFLLVTLEIKRETVIGELNSFRKCLLPIIAAIGGMVVPALIYVAFNWEDPVGIRGWAIPTATDTAFSLGVLSLLRRRVPLSLKIFLTAIAIFDDIGSIFVIAIYYAGHLNFVLLSISIVLVISLLILNRLKVGSSLWYAFFGFLLWAFLLNSGVHAVLAGVVLALFIPVELPGHGPFLVKWEQFLHPYVAYGVLPLFAFANAGVDFRGFMPQELLHPVSMGIGIGLLAGKPIGVFTATWLAVKTRICKMPLEINYRGIVGAALICGIGFTMSLFVGELAFGAGDSYYDAWLRIGVMSGSLMAALAGFLWFKWVVR